MLQRKSIAVEERKENYSLMHDANKNRIPLKVYLYHNCFCKAIHNSKLRRPVATITTVDTLSRPELLEEKIRNTDKSREQAFLQLAYWTTDQF